MQVIIVLFAKYLIIASVLLFLYAGYKVAKKQQKRFLIVSLCSLPLAYIIAKILDHVFYDTRPFVTEHIHPLIAHVADNGFPSDHALITMTFAAIVLRFDKRLGSILALLSLAIGFARVAAHVHHTIDILGAVCVAFVAVGIVVSLFDSRTRLTSMPE